jgi:hypothetical protein
MSMRGRTAYNPVSSTDEAEDLEAPTTGIDTTTGTEVLSRPRSTNRSRRAENNNYSAITTKQEEEEDAVAVAVINSSTSLVDTMEKESSSATSVGYDSDSSSGAGDKVTIIILDSAQKRFPIAVNPEWTVAKFKKVGAYVHKIAPPSQRLIFRGRMLEDSKTLKETGIHQDDVIIHLFPKPRVTVVSGDSSVMSASTDGADGEDNGGAHVPQIFLDEEEQERRGQILVLGSYEIAEAQNNVRLLSLLLGTICVMRLLALLSIATGADEVPAYQDDLTPPESGGGGNSTDDGMHPHVDYEPRVWENQDYFDLLVSMVGFLVARMGMRATHENTSQLATRYLIGTLIAGILWNVWNVFEFTMFVKEESVPKDDDTEIPLTQDDFRTIAIFTVVLPVAVWFLCCARAWQFRHLIEEAELEAAERIRSELNLSEGVETTTVPNEENARELDEISSSNHRHTIV